MRAAIIAITIAAVAAGACGEQRSPSEPQPVDPTVSGPTVAGGSATDEGADAPTAAALFRTDPGDARSPEITQALAVVYPTAGSKARGVVKLTAVDGGVRVEAEVAGVSPGKHAYHVHVWGDCSSIDGESAGPHFNFSGSSLATDVGHITGNLGEIEVADDGTGTHSTTIEGASLVGPYAIIGRAIVLHERGNDPSQPPDGGAGGRIACGVIGVDAPQE